MTMITDSRVAAEHACGLAELDDLARHRSTREERRAVLDRTVTLPDGRAITWGEATAADLRAMDCYVRRHGARP
jgi:hypothetical protein